MSLNSNEEVVNGHRSAFIRCMDQEAREDEDADKSLIKEGKTVLR